MNKLLIIIMGFIILSAFNITDNNETFKKMYGLQGIWKMTTKRGIICEEWKKINNDYLQSKGYLIKGNDTIVTESVALTINKKGIFYTSTVEYQNNRQPVAFKMTKATGNSFVCNYRSGFYNNYCSS